MSRLAILTPVGPGHESIATRAFLSALSAWKIHRGPFHEFRFFFLDDTQGKHGRALARNILLERAVKGWNADWVIHLDSTDLIHPKAFQALQHAFQQHPEALSFWGCHSLICHTQDAHAVAYQGSLLQQDPQHPHLTHIYRTRHDLQPMTWDLLLQNENVGTLGTLGCISAPLSYRVGFLPELPAAEFWEHLHSCLASAPFWKLPQPIVIVDRVLPSSNAHNDNPNADPLANHNPRLNAAIAAISETWRTRGRTPLSYHELEDRWLSRFQHRSHFEHHVHLEHNWDHVLLNDPRFPHAQ